jgi:hypothetical protein
LFVHLDIIHGERVSNIIVDWVAREGLLQLDCLFPTRAASDRDGRVTGLFPSSKVRCICEPRLSWSTGTTSRQPWPYPVGA